MVNLFKIPKTAYDGFLDLIEIGPDKLDQLAREIEALDLTLDLPSLVKKLASAIDVPEDRLERAFYTVLFPLNGLRSEYDIPPAKFLRLLEEMIANQGKEWHEEHGGRWRLLNPKIEPLLAPNGYVAQLNKTFRLLSNRPTQARGFKILTELRPVYDDEVASLRAMVLTGTLVIDYEEGGAQKRLHLMVDQADLNLLQEQLDRAEKKVQVLEEQASRLGVPVLVAGTEKG